MRTRSLLFVTVLLAAACGPGSFDGKVSGYPLAVGDAAFAVVRDSNGRMTGAVLAMSDTPNICDLVKANREPRNATTFYLWFFRYNSDRAQIAPEAGEYTVSTATLFPSAGNHAYADFEKNDVNCTNVLGDAQSTGKSGLVKVTELRPEPGGKMAGDFDITFGDQNDKVKGGFSAPFCDAVISWPDRRNCE